MQGLCLSPYPVAFIVSLCLWWCWRLTKSYECAYLSRLLSGSSPYGVGIKSSVLCLSLKAPPSGSSPYGGVGASQSHMNVPISQGTSRAHLLMVLAHHKHKVISMCLSLEAGSSRARLLMVLVLAPHKVISMCLCLNLKLKAQGSSRARLGLVLGSSP